MFVMHFELWAEIEHGLVPSLKTSNQVCNVRYVLLDFSSGAVLQNGINLNFSIHPGVQTYPRHDAQELSRTN